MPILATSTRPPEWWPHLAPYLRKLVVAALKRNGLNVSDWSTS